MIHKPVDRTLFVPAGAVKTTDGSDNLVDGQLMIAQYTGAGANGLKRATNLSALDKRKKDLVIKVGVDKKVKSRSYEYKDESSQVFALEDIVDFKVNAPQVTTALTDEVIIGYNGHDPASALSFKAGDNNFNLKLKISGGSLGWSGGNMETEEFFISQPIAKANPYNSCTDVEPCDAVPCRPIIMELVENLRNREISGGRKLSELVDIIPIFSCNQEDPISELTYYTLEVCDTGDANALALVQAQYEEPVRRLERHGSISTYQVLVESAPSDYEQSLASIMANCSTCPAGYDLVAGGEVYSFTVRVGVTPVIGNIPGAVTDTLVKQGSDGEVDVWTVLVDNKLTDAEITTLIGTYPTIMISYVGEKSAVCENDTINKIEWVEGETCGVAERTYRITLADTECGESRLAELQGVYPDYEVEIAPSGETLTTATITLTGTSGTANVNIGGDDYLATFATDLATTSANFVTAYASAVATATGGTLTLVANKPVFAVNTDDYATVTVTNATTNLAGTVATAVTDILLESLACQTTYQITVGTNMVCDECDDIFKDYYTSVAPHSYDGNEWTAYFETPIVESDACLCGIRFIGRLWKMNPETSLMYKVPYIEDSVDIEVTAGFSDYTDLQTSGVDFKQRVRTQKIREKRSRDMVAGNLLCLERTNSIYFTDFGKDWDLLRRKLTGRETGFSDLDSQYVDYALTINHSKYTQGFGNRSQNYITYHFIAEYGRHAQVEAELNRLVSAVGLPVVNA